MNRPWRQFGEELTRRGKSLQWLAVQMGCSIQRVQNWTTRGVPPAAFPELAAAFDESIDWVAGRGPPRRGAISREAARLAEEFDRMSPTEQKRLIQMLRAVSDNPKTDPGDFLGGMSHWGDLHDDEDAGSK